MTYLVLLQILPSIILTLCHLAYPTKNLATTIQRTAPWRLKGKPCVARCKRVKRCKKPVRELQDKVKDHTLRTYLFPAALLPSRLVVTLSLLLDVSRVPPSRTPTTLLSKVRRRFKWLHRRSDLVLTLTLLGWITTHQSAPHLFEDLRLDNNKGQVDGIYSGLYIAGQGTFKFNITDNDGKIHAIKIPNSLYLPNLKRCLLLPQHWVQEAGEEQTWMGNYRDSCVLNWRGGKKTVPFQSTTNVPVFYTASSSRSYCTFAATFEAMEAPYL